MSKKEITIFYNTIIPELQAALAEYLSNGWLLISAYATTSGSEVMHWVILERTIVE